MARGSLKRCLRFWAAVGSVTAGSCRVRRSAGLRVRCIRDASLRRRGHGDGCLEQPQVAEWPWPLLVQEHSPGVCVLSVRPAYRPLGSGLHGPADDRDPQGTGGHPCSPRPCWHSGSGRVGGTGVRMSSGQVTCYDGHELLLAHSSVWTCPVRDPFCLAGSVHSCLMVQGGCQSSRKHIRP